MPSSRRETRVVEAYARSLLEAGKSEGRVFEDLHDIALLAQAAPEVFAVLRTMIERDQLELLPDVADAYRLMTEEDEDIVGVTVTTAVPLDEDLRQSLTERLEHDFGTKVFLIEQVDPSIIGGVIFEARGERRDISVKSRLRSAHETLSTVRVTSGSVEGGETAHV